MSECEQFQCASMDHSLEVVDFIPHYRDATRSAVKPMSEQPKWKYEVSPVPHTEANKRHSFCNPLKNISFQDDNESKCSSSDDKNSDGDEQHLSSLSEYYRKQQQVYKKKANFGTSWVGRRQYFASLFVEPVSTSNAYCPEEGVRFDSDFESGNLLLAYKIAEFEYDLLLQNDINTKGNTQWFYFRMMNIPGKQPIKINIVNLRKSDSLFNYGMLPCIHSSQAQKYSKQGWQRKGSDVSYRKNEHQLQNTHGHYYTLSFTLLTSYDNDVLKVAHCYPYTYTDLLNYLAEIDKVKYKKQMVQRETIAMTVGKNKVEVITIKEANGKLKLQLRPLLIFMARQHPGQSPGSYVCEGLIDFFLSKDKQSQYLRKNYQIKIIPMVNPDGVVLGNYRTNLLGLDLNRRWDGQKCKLNCNPSNHENQPSISYESIYVKKYLIQLLKGRQTAFILDLHGNPWQVRVFPLLCSKLAPNCIRFQDSTFTSEQTKRKTARVQFGLSFKTQNIFTFQVSFFGYVNKQRQKRHFTTDGYRQLGSILGKAIYMHEKGKQNYESKQTFLLKRCVAQLKDNAHLIRLGEKDNSGSESEPQECEIGENQSMKLLQNEDYLRQQAKTVKIVRRVIKKQPVIKQTAKSLRQMQVLDIALVNSIFPNDVIALIPSSYYLRHKKQNFSIAVQTQHCPLIKIYQMCKMQDKNHNLSPSRMLSQISPRKTNPENDSPAPDNKGLRHDANNSNLFRSNIIGRPQSSAVGIDCLMNDSNYCSVSQQKNRNLKKRRESTCQLPPKGKNGISRASQTNLTLNANSLIKQSLICMKEDSPTRSSSFQLTTLGLCNGSSQISNNSIIQPNMHSLLTIQNGSKFMKGIASKQAELMLRKKSKC